MRAWETSSATLSLPPTNRTTNATFNGTGVDMLGSTSGLAVFNTGAVTDGNHAFKLQESTTSGGTYTDIPAARIVFGSLPTYTSANANATGEVGFLISAGNGFVRAVLTTTGVTTGGFSSAVIVTGEFGPRQYPPR